MSRRLDAVNRCLKAIGEDPVTTLDSGYAEATKANTKVDQITEEVLSMGWHTNTDYNVVLTPNVDGEIVIPDEYISIDTVDRSAWLDVTVRRDPNDDIKKLYNLYMQTYTFDDPIHVDIVRLFDIDDLPYRLAAYITALTALRFAEDEVGAPSLDAALGRDERFAWSQLLDQEADEEDSNVLTDSAYMRAVTGRNNELSGR